MKNKEIQEKIKSLPVKSGVYLFKNKQDKIIYIGKANKLRSRVRSYFQRSRPIDPRLQILVSKVHDLEYIITDTEIEALILENNLIKKHKPRYNINLKDDKSYPYIRITNEDFPQVFPTRNKINDGSAYFGPYTNVKEMRAALNVLKKIFTIRTCKYSLDPETVRKKKVDLCLEYYIHKCKGPCQGLQSKTNYDLMIKNVQSFLNGKTEQIFRQLKSEMEQDAEQLKFEDAARTRDKIEILEQYRNQQKVVLNDTTERDIIAMHREEEDACAVVFKIRDGKLIGRGHYYFTDSLNSKEGELLNRFINQYYNLSDDIPREILVSEAIEQEKLVTSWLQEKTGQKVSFVIPQIGDKRKLLELCRKNARYLLEELQLQKMKSSQYIPNIVRTLQRDLNLPKSPVRIECFDISNIQGTDPVASMVCFINGKPKKSEYRKFKIRLKQTPDDFAMINEAVKRRYARILKEQKEMPDLVIIDGGKGQLSSALAALNELQTDSVPIIGLAKRLEEIFRPGISEAQTLPKSSPSLRLLQQIRDEAHRFAITFHRQRRSKRTLQSELDNISGIGESRRKLLLSKIGSVKELRKLSAAEISAKSGIPLKFAQNIEDYFKK